MGGKGVLQYAPTTGTTGITSSGNIISWDISGNNGGFSFTSDNQIMINAKIDDDPSNPDVSADKVYLGMSKYTQSYLPIVIDTTTTSAKEAASTIVDWLERTMKIDDMI